MTCVIDLFRPLEVFTDGYSKIFSTVCLGQYVPMKLVLGVMSKPLVCADADDLALFWVKPHLPSLLPLTQCIEVIL